MAAEVDSAIDELKTEEQRKTQFVSDVSHELRTPLTAIRGAAETLLDGDVEPDDQERFLSTIALEAERLGRLANDLLTLQRIEGATGELPLRQVDLRLAADRAAAMLEPLLEDREVTLTVNGRAPLVLGDVDRLQQVVSTWWTTRAASWARRARGRRAHRRRRPRGALGHRRRARHPRRRPAAPLRPLLPRGLEPHARQRRRRTGARDRPRDHHRARRSHRGREPPGGGARMTVVLPAIPEEPHVD